MEAAPWSFSSYVASGLARLAGGVRKTVPSYFWSNVVQLTSRVKARFFTGVQTMLPPITAMLKSGLQLPVRASCDTAKPQIGAIGTVDGARPVGVPVVGEATAEAPSLHRFKIAIG